MHNPIAVLWGRVPDPTLIDHVGVTLVIVGLILGYPLVVWSGDKLPEKRVLLAGVFGILVGAILFGPAVERHLQAARRFFR